MPTTAAFVAEYAKRLGAALLMPMADAIVTILGFDPDSERLSMPGRNAFIAKYMPEDVDRKGTMPIVVTAVEDIAVCNDAGGGDQAVDVTDLMGHCVARIACSTRRIGECSTGGVK